MTPEQRRKLFPVLPKYRGYIAGVAWDLVAKHEEQAMRNHYQTLERLAERGGLSLSELAAVLEDRRWRNMSVPEALAVIKTVENANRNEEPQS